MAVAFECLIRGMWGCGHCYSSGIFVDSNKCLFYIVFKGGEDRNTFISDRVCMRERETGREIAKERLRERRKNPFHTYVYRKYLRTEARFHSNRLQSFYCLLLAAFNFFSSTFLLFASAFRRPHNTHFHPPFIRKLWPPLAAFGLLFAFFGLPYAFSNRIWGATNLLTDIFSPAKAENTLQLKFNYGY